jgi:hypothetical protein
VGVSQVYLGQLFFKLAVRPQYRSRAVDLFTPAQLKTITKLCNKEQQEKQQRFSAFMN